MASNSVEVKKKNQGRQESSENAHHSLLNLSSTKSEILKSFETLEMLKFGNFTNFEFCRGLETLMQNRRRSLFFQTVDLGEMVMCLEDLINYFAQPEDEMGN
jgi:ryanodine receptor 2